LRSTGTLPELWRRFTINLRRVLARQTGLTAAEFARRCRVSFVKVAEFQRRGVVHFHALIRLDGPGEDYQPPQIGIDAAALADGIRQAAAQVRLTVEMPDGPDVVLRFGTQLDTQTVNGGPTGELAPEHAARYIAKYAIKSAEDFGLGERRTTPEALSLLDVSDHVGRLVRTAWQLGEHSAYEGLCRWMHMLGFRGHFASKAVAIPRPSAPSAGNAAPTANAKPLNTFASCSTKTPPSSSRTGNSPESATSPPETQHSHCLPPPEHANNNKPPVKLPKPTRRKEILNQMGNVIALGSGARDHDLAPGKQLAERAVYTVVEVAQLLSLSRGTAYALVRDGTIPALRLGGRWVVPRVRFHAWLDSLTDDNVGGRY
jgi:excisionase family DNA binding protein